MTDPVEPYPVPAEDADNRPMLEAWRGGRLLLPACRDCGRLFFYPRPLCPHCWSDALDWRAACGRGRIVAFSLVRRPNHAAFFPEAPIVMAEIRLEEAVAMLARIVEVDAGSVRSGMPVEALPLPQASRYPLPTFRPMACQTT